MAPQFQGDEGAGGAGGGLVARPWRRFPCPRRSLPAPGRIVRGRDALDVREDLPEGGAPGDDHRPVRLTLELRLEQQVLPPQALLLDGL